jgi:uncharacterized BrkB/YihY/UPF0761 family membrane protein
MTPERRCDDFGVIAVVAIGIGSRVGLAFFGIVVPVVLIVFRHRVTALGERLEPFPPGEGWLRVYRRFFPWALIVVCLAFIYEVAPTVLHG